MGKRYNLPLMLLMLATPAHGQSNYAVVTGTVSDAQQLPVAGATIELNARAPEQCDLLQTALSRFARNSQGQNPQIGSCLRCWATKR